MAKHRAHRTPALIAMSVAAATTVAAALTMSGSAGAADTTTPEPACPNGYLPAIGQQVDPQSTICITAGPAANGDIHAIVRIDPALCAHIAVGTNKRSDGTVPADAVRTLRCPRVVPVTPVPATETPAPPEVPAPATNQPLPPAPVPPIVGGNLPVTH